VLAHVGGANAASCGDRVYVAWIAERLGPASERALGEDATTLAGLLGDFEVLARVQALAWVFADPTAARACAELDLTEIRAGVDTRALATCLSAGPVAEVLRAAAELELDAIEALGEPVFDREAFAATLSDVSRAAPELSACRVEHVRSLPRRGRAFEGASIIVGVPGVAGAEAEHVTWQAAHEATVLACSPGPFADVERRALSLLRSRAGSAGLAERHAQWLSTLDLSGLSID
jgi:hypothetical protein